MAGDHPSKQDLDKLFSRMETAEKNRDFWCSFPLPDDASLQEFLKAADALGIKRLSFAPCDYFGSADSVRLAKNLHFAPNLEALNLNDIRAGKKGGLALLEALASSKIKDLSINGIEFPDAAQPLLLKVALSAPLERLSFANATMGETRYGFIGKLAQILPDTNVRDLNFEGVVSTPESCKALAEVLPRTKLTALQFSSFREKEAQNILIDTLPDTALRHLNMRSCYDFKEPEAVRLMQTIPNTDISFLYFSASSRYGSTFFQEAANMMRTPKNRLEKVFITAFKTPLEKRTEMSDARDELMQNVAYRKGIALKTDQNKNVTAIPADMSLSEALEAGLLKQALDARKMPLSAAECLKKDAEGNCFAQKAARAERLDLVFNPAYWNNAKEIQTVWDSLEKEHGWQLDGQKGRPSCQKFKNEIMRRAVVKSLSKNARSGKR